MKTIAEMALANILKNLKEAQPIRTEDIDEERGYTSEDQWSYNSGHYTVDTPCTEHVHGSSTYRLKVFIPKELTDHFEIAYTRKDIFEFFEFEMLENETWPEEFPDRLESECYNTKNHGLELRRLRVRRVGNTAYWLVQFKVQVSHFEECDANDYY